ncbi:MAG TPA: hypothetical protein PKN75_03260 [Bacteroidia bacterium]|nr:hypothetical protein [Bacteroidia bacterium]HNU32587.1 hypothetical protein [Bacteroidia bacterium]
MFKSEKKIKSDIQGTWDMIIFKTDELDQTWIFTSDSLYLLRQESLGSSNYDTVDVVDYKIDVTVSAPYVIVDGIELDPEYNKKWTITQLDTKVLAIACDYKNGGVLQKEFVKR